MRRPLLAATLSAAAMAALAAPATASAHTPSLPLGPSGLHEQRETEQLAPGVALTSIVRGESSAADAWTRAVAQGLAKAAPQSAATIFVVKTLAGLEDELGAQVVRLWEQDAAAVNGRRIPLEPARMDG